jgi:hypothetical protein
MLINVYMLDSQFFHGTLKLDLCVCVCVFLLCVAFMYRVVNIGLFGGIVEGHRDKLCLGTEVLVENLGDGCTA